jgi:hypothetical protein
VLGLAVVDKLGVSLEEEKSGLLGLAVVDKLGLSLEEEKSRGRRLDSNRWAGSLDCRRASCCLDWRSVTNP